MTSLLGAGPAWLGVAVVVALGVCAGGCRTEGRRDVMVVHHEGVEEGRGSTTMPARAVGPITVRVDDGTGSGVSGAGTGVAGLEEFVGEHCVVHLRRDAAGMASQTPMPLSDERFARAASVAGVLRRVTAGGVVVEIERGVRWVPVEVILAVDFPEGMRAATTRAVGR